jgi:hypothetical protein
MKIEKALFRLEGDLLVDPFRLCVVVAYQGRKWLAAPWIDNLETGKSMPERIVCLDLLEHQKSTHPDYQYVLTRPVPKGVFEGQIPSPSEGIFVVVENPQIEFETHELLFPEP